MLTTGLVLLQERIDAAVGRRPRPLDDPSPSSEQALRRHRDDYLESDPACRQRHYDRTRSPSENLEYYRALRDRLGAAGVPLADAPIDLGEFGDWLDRYAVLSRFYRRLGEMRVEKCLEHYLVARELRLRRGDTYLDMASAGSPWARVLRYRGVEAYRLDLIYRPGIHGINIGGDAVATGLPDGFARAVSIQCAFELLHGETDRGFLEETARLLAPGGRAAIAPLYLDDTHFVLHSPTALPPEGSGEPGAVRVWRDDAFTAPYSRHYSPESFAERIAGRLPAGLSGCVRYASNLAEVMDAYPGQRIYSFFTFALEKAGGRRRRSNAIVPGSAPAPAGTKPLFSSTRREAVKEG
jgi:SAM-dependent methyltransferase